MWLAFLFKRDTQNIILHTVIKDIDGLEKILLESITLYNYFKCLNFTKKLKNTNFCASNENYEI